MIAPNLAVIAALAAMPLPSRAEAPYPPSPVIRKINWAPASTIVRQARGSDNWPTTWGDDDALYTAYGDGRGFRPFTEKKLSLGLARLTGNPPDFEGTNLRAPTAEQTGDGPRGKKASGMLMVEGVLYMWARNADNSQLAWSRDRGKTWEWSKWRFTASFGCPTFLNFGRNYAGARDDYVYVYSFDSDSAYEPADRMVLARVPEDKIVRREFGSGIHANVDAMARIGYLYLHGGRWDGRQILPKEFVKAAARPVKSVVGIPVHDDEHHGNASDHYGLLWWNNADGTLENVPRDAYWSWGLYDSLIVVIPSLDLVVSRAGKSWDRKSDGHYDVLRPFLEPIVASVKDGH